MKLNTANASAADHVVRVGLLKEKSKGRVEEIIIITSFEEK